MNFRQEWKRIHELIKKSLKNIIGGGSKLHSKVSKKVLAGGLGLSMLFAMAPLTKTWADDSTTSTMVASSNQWGNETVRADGVKQYMDSNGRNRVEISSENIDENSILWLFENSYGTSAWYGLKIKDQQFALDNGLSFYVQWIHSDEPAYKDHYNNLDETNRALAENANSWILLIGVEDSNGSDVNLDTPVEVYVQIGNDWNGTDLKNGLCIHQNSEDEKLNVTFGENMEYPDGSSGRFGIITIEHFSPYFIYDKLTATENIDASGSTTNNDSSTNNEIPANNEVSPINNDSKNNEKSPVKTSDSATDTFITFLSIVQVLVLGVMISLTVSKRKFEE